MAKTDVLALQETHISAQAIPAFEKWAQKKGFTAYVLPARVTKKGTINLRGKVRLKTHISLGAAILVRTTFASKYTVVHHPIHGFTIHALEFFPTNSFVSASSVSNV